MLLSEAFDHYKRDVIVFRNQSKRTEEQHHYTLQSLLKFIGSDIFLCDLTFELIRQWKIAMEDRGFSSETIRGYIIKLRVVLAYCEKSGMKCLSPDIVPVPQRSEKIPVFITKEQVTKLIDSTARIKNKAIISLLYASGIRVSELCSLNIADLHDMSFTVVGKGSRIRLCFYDERTKFYLSEYLKEREDNQQPLFLSDNGRRITPGAVQETFKWARRKAGIPVCSPHTLRHTFATELMKNNMHIYSVSRLLGHKSLNTTQMYLHVTDNHLKEEYRKHHEI